MPNLRRYTLSKDRQQKNWKLTADSNGRVVRRFDTKDDATTRGVLGEAVGGEGGSIRIEKEHGGYQEERTFPRSRDPRRSPG